MDNELDEKNYKKFFERFLNSKFIVFIYSIIIIYFLYKLKMIKIKNLITF